MGQGGKQEQVGWWGCESEKSWSRKLRNPYNVNLKCLHKLCRSILVGVTVFTTSWPHSVSVDHGSGHPQS